MTETRLERFRRRPWWFQMSAFDTGLVAALSLQAAFVTGSYVAGALFFGIGVMLVPLLMAIQVAALKLTGNDSWLGESATPARSPDQPGSGIGRSSDRGHESDHWLARTPIRRRAVLVYVVSFLMAASLSQRLLGVASPVTMCVVVVYVVVGVYLGAAMKREARADTVREVSSGTSAG
jgi:hypothetical protein